jgi:hypothetical protein
MAKTEVYSWRIEPSTKAALEEEARERDTPVAAVLDEIVGDWLARRPRRTDDEEQRRLRAAAAPYVGAFHGGDPHRAERARERLRGRLEGRRAAP